MLRWWRQFLRQRSPGRHAFGAAVTSIPSAPVRIGSRSTDPGACEVGPAPGGPQVQLGFRDGTMHQLDPASAQAKALDELARVLTRRD